MSVREILKKLHADGWVVTRQIGSHRQMHHPTKPGTVTVAGKPSDDIKVGTVASIMKQPGLTKDD